MRVPNLDVLQRRTLVWAGLAVVLTAFDGSVLVLALPAIASDFHAQIPGLSNLGSVLALGSLGALPLATLADRFGRRRLIAIGVALFANFVESLIEAGNILGSLFYGSILGLFLVAFFLRSVQGTAVFFAAVISQVLVLVLFFTTGIGYLWYNLIGCAGVILFGVILQLTVFGAPPVDPTPTPA